MSLKYNLFFPNFILKGKHKEKSCLLFLQSALIFMGNIIVHLRKGVAMK